MSLERAIQELTEAVKANTELMSKLTGIISSGALEQANNKPETPAEVAATKEAPKKAEPKKTPAKAAPKKAEPKQTDIEDATEIDYKTQVRPLVLKHHSEKGREATESILSEFGAATALEIKPEQYAELIGRLTESLTEESLA